MRLAYLRHRLPQLAESDLAGVPAAFARYQRQLSQALHEMSRLDVRAMKELDTAPALLVTRATSDQSIAVDTLTTVQFNAVAIDTAAGWDAATYTYTPPEAGFYRCAWGVDFRDTANFVTTAYGYARCAGALAIAYGNGAVPEIGVAAETIVECDGTTGVKVEAFVHQGTAPVLGAFASPYRTWLAVTFIGKRPIY